MRTISYAFSTQSHRDLNSLVRQSLCDIYVIYIYTNMDLLSGLACMSSSREIRQTVFLVQRTWFNRRVSTLPFTIIKMLKHSISHSGMPSFLIPFVNYLSPMYNIYFDLHRNRALKSHWIVKRTKITIILRHSFIYQLIIYYIINKWFYIIL